MIRRADRAADLETWAAIKNAVQPGEPVTAGDLRHDPSGRFLLYADVGCAVVKPSSLAGCAFTMVRVVAEARSRGIGSALLEACSDEARTLGLESLYGRVDGDDPVSLGFVQRRGFAEIGREVEQIRELGVESRSSPPAGILLAQLAPEHLEGVYAVAVDATPDMALDAAVEAAPYDRWLAEMHGRFIQVALEDDLVVGFATLAPLGAQRDTLEHELTGVLRSHRRRGIAEAMKRAQIAWAAAAGYRRLVTYTQEGNDAMRSLNLKLGYRERLAAIAVQGPLE
jgi:mycothiol synthase